jgi:hypothetical protein
MLDHFKPCFSPTHLPEICPAGWREHEQEKEQQRPRNPDRPAKLAIRKEPYWLVLEKGRALGYAKGANGGTWIARYYNPHATPSRAKRALGAADDVSDADGKMVLDWGQAQAAAREWFKTAFFQATGERIRTGVYTVEHAVEDYLEDRERHGMANVDRVRKDFEAHVLPYLGRDAVEHLTRKRIEDWMRVVAESGLRRRGKPRFRRTGYGRKDKRNTGEWTRPEMTRMMRRACDQRRAVNSETRSPVWMASISRARSRRPTQVDKDGAVSSASVSGRVRYSMTFFTCRLAGMARIRWQMRA